MLLEKWGDGFAQLRVATNFQLVTKTKPKKLHRGRRVIISHFHHKHKEAVAQRGEVTSSKITQQAILRDRTRTRSTKLPP